MSKKIKKLFAMGFSDEVKKMRSIKNIFSTKKHSQFVMKYHKKIAFICV